MIDRLITIGRFLQIPTTALRYILVIIFTGFITIVGTRKYMKASAELKAIAQVAATQKQILLTLQQLIVQQEEWQTHTDNIVVVMDRSFKDIIDLSREAAKGNQALLDEISEKEAHIQELFNDKIRKQMQARKKRPPPVVLKGRIVSEELN